MSFGTPIFGCWHDVFDEYPEWASALAFAAGTDQVAAFGANSAQVATEDCDDGIDNDGDGHDR